MLGIGGVRALRALGITPTVWHLNEGHAAFVALQRIRELIEKGRSFDDALKRCGDRPCSRPTRRCRPGTTRFRSTWSRNTSPASWGEIGQHRPISSRSASTTTAAGRSST